MISNYKPYGKSRFQARHSTTAFQSLLTSVNPMLQTQTGTTRCNRPIGSRLDGTAVLGWYRTLLRYGQTLLDLSQTVPGPALGGNALSRFFLDMNLQH